jgi:UPF0755 protein
LKSTQLLIARIGFAFYVIGKTTLYYLRRFFFFFILGVFISIIIMVKLLLFPSYPPENLEIKPQKNIFVPRGSSLREIANILQNEELLSSPEIFILLGKISGYQNRLPAGMFEVPQGLHPWHLMKYLIQPKLAEVKVTLPEGILLSEMAGILRRELEIDSSQFMHLVQDSNFCRSLGLSIDYLEGYLLPETYLFTYGMREGEIIHRLVDSTLSIFQPDSVQWQMQKLGMDMHKILTMASIIEGEVVVDSERVLVSSVYHNRLKRRWHLAADPTIQFIIPGPARRLLNKDLEIDSPYNTYKYIGLPPGPINNPGKKSIMAALFPADTQYLYFVATGNGGHRFSRNASEHAYWKEKFDQVRREMRKNNK